MDIEELRDTLIGIILFIVFVYVAYVIIATLYGQAIAIVVGVIAGFLFLAWLYGRYGEAPQRGENLPPAPYQEAIPKSTAYSRPNEVSAIIRKIEDFPPSKSPRNEEQCEIMLVSYLQAFFPNIRRQEQYPDMRIDAIIDNIGIEIKFQPSQYDFHALYSQIEDRLKFLDSVIVTIFSERDVQATEKFQEKIRDRGWLDNRVFVISKP